MMTPVGIHISAICVENRADWNWSEYKNLYVTELVICGVEVNPIILDNMCDIFGIHFDLISTYKVKFHPERVQNSISLEIVFLGLRAS